MVNFRKKYLKYKKKYIKCKKNLKGGSASNIEPGSEIMEDFNELKIEPGSQMWEDFTELIIQDIELYDEFDGIGFTNQVLNNYMQELFIILDTIYNSDLNNLDDYLDQYNIEDENIVNARAWYELVETLKTEHNITDNELLYFICENGFFSEQNIQNIIQHIQQNNQPQNIPVQQLILLNQQEEIRRTRRRRRRH